MALGEDTSNQAAIRFYDDLAAVYHLIFQDWNASMRRQGEALAHLLPAPDAGGTVLDCACGIGTQAIALAARGYKVEGSDVSSAAIERARREALTRGLDITFRVDDMRTLQKARPSGYGAVIVMDNALPHLDGDDEVFRALTAMRGCLAPRGTLLLSLRDYGELMQQKPRGMPPAFFTDGELRRFVHQVWDWHDERRYSAHLYITRETARDLWQVHHSVGEYRAVTPAEVASAASQAGFADVRVLLPEATGYYQPVISAIAATWP